MVMAHPSYIISTIESLPSERGRAFVKRFLRLMVVSFFALNAANTNGEIFAMSDQTVVLETNQGVVEIKLMPDVAPKACENFIQLVSKGYYNGIVFHRVIKGFMIQGGDPSGTGRAGASVWGKPFEDEPNPNVQFDGPGILAMANSGPNTNGSQFFITTAGTPWLNMKHTIFGRVTAGYEVVQKIENVATDPSDKPLAEQKIVKAYLKP